MVWLLSFTKPVPGLKSYSSKTQGCQQLGIGGGAVSTGHSRRHSKGLWPELGMQFLDAWGGAESEKGMPKNLATFAQQLICLLHPSSPGDATQLPGISV